MIGPFATYADTIALRFSASAVKDPIPSADASHIVDQMESAILDSIFDNGHILTTFPPLFSDVVEEPTRTSDLSSEIRLARESRANWFVWVDLRFLPTVPKGVPQLKAASIGLFNISKGTLKTVELNSLPENMGQAGKYLAQALLGLF